MFRVSWKNNNKRIQHSHEVLVSPDINFLENACVFNREITKRNEIQWVVLIEFKKLPCCK